jgi:RND family efflux transporter MFP subunit
MSDQTTSPLARIRHARSARLPLALLVFAGIISGILLMTPPQIVSSAKTPAPVTVRTVTAQPTTRQLYVHSEGTVYPRAETRIVAQVAGEVVWLADTLRVGGQFAAGEVLVQLDQRDYQVALKSAEAQLRQARADHEYAAAEAARIAALFKKDLASTTELDRSRRALEGVEIDLARTTIQAPYDGRVRTESVDLGQFLQKGAVLTTVYATDAMEIKLPIPDAQLAFLHEALTQTGVLADTADIPVVLSATYAGRKQTWTGQLVRTEASIDERSRFIYLVAEVTETINAQGTQLPVGLFVDATITGRWFESIVTLPRISLRDTNSVWVVDEANTLHAREVSVLRVTEDNVLISAGLSPGDTVNASPLQFVVEGMPVVVVD